MRCRRSHFSYQYCIFLWFWLILIIFDDNFFWSCEVNFSFEQDIEAICDVSFSIDILIFFCFSILDPCCYFQQCFLILGYECEVGLVLEQFSDVFALFFCSVLGDMFGDQVDKIFFSEYFDGGACEVIIVSELVDDRI